MGGIQRISNRVLRYSNGVRYLNRTSSPYISPNTFKTFSDLDLDANFEQSRKEIKNASVIFCNSGDVTNFFCNYGSTITAKILIFGNNDVDFEDFSFKIPKSVKRIYLQNSTINDAFFRTIPIGLENLDYLTNGLPHLVKTQYAVREKSLGLLVGPFGNTHPERNLLQSYSSRVFRNVDFISSRLSPKRYADLSASYSHIACPRGNGLDTHRFWETIYRGSVPVVLASNWSKNLASLGIPVLEASSWEEALVNFECSHVEFLRFTPRKIRPIWDFYWEEQIKNDLHA